MVRGLLAFLSLCLLLPACLAAEHSSEAETITDFLQTDDLATYQRLEEYSDFQLASTGFDDFPITSEIFDIDYRSPGKAFFYSLMVPAAGQIYTGSKIKAAVFLGIEAISWVAYFSYNSKGKTRESDYEIFADSYWDPQRYQNWLIETYGIQSDTLPYINEHGEKQQFGEHLPDTRTQQYYEMIGKYEQFRYGWTDTDYRVNDSTSAYREGYLVDRDDANDAYGKAKVAVIATIINHMLSAFDAALSAKKYNRKQDTFTEIRVKARLAKYDGEQIPQIALTYKFF